MKITSAATATACLLVSGTHAFAPAASMPRSAAAFGGVVTALAPASRLFMSSEQEAPAATDFASAMPTNTEDEFTRFGCTPEEVGLGVDVNELLQWCGTKEDIIQKVLRDNRGLARESAEEEVAKLLRDVEIVNRVLFFERNKDQINLKQQAEQNLSNPNTILTYAIWLIGGASFPYLRRRFIDPKFASGEWEELHINIDKFLPGGGAAAVASPVVDVVAQSAMVVDIDTAASVLLSTSSTAAVADVAHTVVSNAM